MALTKGQQREAFHKSPLPVSRRILDLTKHGVSRGCVCTYSSLKKERDPVMQTVQIKHYSFPEAAGQGGKRVGGWREVGVERKW